MFSNDKKLWFVFCAALLLRAACVALAGASPSVAINIDSISYVTPTRNMAEHGAFASGEWPDIKTETERTPGYPVFLIPFLKRGVLNIAAVQWAQVLIGALTVCLVYMITNLVGGSLLAASIAGFGLAIDSVAIAHTPIVLTETLFLFLWTGAFFCLIKGTIEEKKCDMNLMSAGLLFGLASLVRPAGVYYFIFALPFLLLSLHRTQPRRWKRSITTFFAAALLIPLAWTIRNGAQSGVYTFSSIQSGNLRVVRALFEVNRTGKSYSDASASLDAEFQKSLPPTPMTSYQINAAYGKWAMKFIVGHPGDYAKFLLKNLLDLLSGNSIKATAWFITKDPTYDPWKIPLHIPNSLWQQAKTLASAHPLFGAALIFYGVFFLLIYLGAIGGAVFLWREQGAALAALLISPVLYIVLVSVDAAAQARYRLPAMPCLFMLAGIGFQRMIKKRN